MCKWKVTVFMETNKGNLAQSTIHANNLTEVSRIIMTFKARKNATVYKYEVETDYSLV